MKKGDIFNIQEGTKAVVLSVLYRDYDNATLGAVYNTYLCYSQNRLFLVHSETIEEDIFDESDTFINTIEKELEPQMGRIICDYCIIPEFDK